MKLLLDTNAYTGFCSRDQNIIKAVKNSTKIYLPFVVVAELRVGFECGTKKKYNESLFNEFLEEKIVEILYPDNITIKQYSYIFKELRVKGSPIPTNDIWIAAIAVQHKIALITKNSHFNKIDELLLYNELKR